jgi:class 3 adenylate cyclase/tetratricopeptide (TPR) repeat protein
LIAVIMTHSLQDQIDQLLQAIAGQESLRPTLGDAVVDASLAALREKLAGLEAESRTARPEQRKQVTVLFADVSGFTALSETIDAEEVLETINALWTRLDGVITEHGGTIDKHIGDAVMALFGAPTAHEDDPEQAIRAALRIQAEVARFRPAAAGAADWPPLQVRIGINTGLVLLGAVGTTDEYTAIGDAVNVASRLEHLAPPGGILIAHDTYRHVTGLFDIEALEPVALKGKIEPVQVYLVRGEQARTFRVSTRGVEGVETRMIGREAELTRLREALRTVQLTRTPHMVSIVGEAGLGKSRLLHEYINWLEQLRQPVHLFKGRTEQQVSTVPYEIIRILLAARFDIRDSDRASVAREKLVRGIVAVMGPEGRAKAECLGQLIGFDFSDRPEVRLLDDARLIRDRAFHYATQFFAAVAGERPIVLFLDDIQWADDGSLDWLEYLLHEGRGIPLLLVCLMRDTLFERRPDWGIASAQRTQIELQPLSDADSRRLVQEILRKIRAIPAYLVDLIVNGADGNPFYMEELIKMLIEDGVITKNEPHWEVELPRLVEIRVPPTLTALLQARLDALPPAEREILQRAAVVGRIFWGSAVEQLGTALLGKSPPVDEILERLCQRELIFDRPQSTFAGDQEFLFKHALLHDVAYESVLKRMRRVYHAEVARWLQDRSGERVAEYAGTIGRHYALAGDDLAAADWYGRAGRQAQDTYAPVAAIDYYRQALALLPDDLAYAPRRVVIQEGLGEMLRVQARFAEATAAFYAMIAAAQLADDGAAKARAWLGLTRLQDNQSELRASLESAARAEEAAQAAGAPAELARAVFARGWANYRLGEGEAALALGERSLALSTALGDQSEIALSLNLLGAAHDMLGHLEEARQCTERALALNRESGSLLDVASSLNNLGASARARGDYEAARAYYEEALDIASKIAFRWGEMSYRASLGGTWVGLGDYAAAERLLRQVIDLPEASRWVGLAAAYRFLAEACLGQGHTEAALAAARRALDLAQDQAHREHIGAAWRVLGLVAARLPAPLPLGPRLYNAPACFSESLRIFTEMGAEGEQARTLRAWAWYALAQGDPEGEKLWEEAWLIFTRLGMDLEAQRMLNGDPAVMPVAG